VSPDWCFNGKTTSIGVERQRVLPGIFLENSRELASLHVKGLEELTFLQFWPPDTNMWIGIGV